jgi:thymidylate synthase ThyX
MQTEVFCLVDSNGRILPPATQATILAKYSRSPSSAKEILERLTNEEADKFQEKWVSQYGHSSVAELAVIPICFEGISIIASKFIESWQRAGYSEKSTRYQVFSRDSFITPPNSPDSMKEFTSKLYDAYDNLYDRTVKHCAKIMNEDPDKPKRIVKARAFDNLRYLLPAGTGTNVACVINMRDLREMIINLKGHSNPEFVELGQKLQIAGMDICPALLKHTEPVSTQFQVRSMEQMCPEFFLNPKPYVKIFKPNSMISPDLEQAIFESILADNGISWTHFCEKMGDRSDHEEVPSIFKWVHISFEIMMDFGAFRDLQRHRRCEQYAELLKPHYGFVVPEDIQGSELENEYVDAMQLVSSYDDDTVINDPNLIQYIIPLGYLHRSVFQMDLKELYYITELRTRPQGHISYRRIAYKMFELAKQRWPKLMQWCKVINPDEIQSIHH